MARKVCDHFLDGLSIASRRSFFSHIFIYMILMRLIVIFHISISFSLYIYRYSWAVSTVMTRQNAIPNVKTANGDGNESTTAAAATAVVENVPALIPLWDFANHMHGVVTTTYNDKLHRIEGAVSANVKKGDQIFIHYGNRNNATLLVHNG